MGIPDLLGCYDGKFFAIELKIKNNKPTELQKVRLQEIETAGGVQGVAYNWGEEEILKKSWIKTRRQINFVVFYKCTKRGGTDCELKTKSRSMATLERCELRVKCTGEA